MRGGLWSMGQIQATACFCKSSCIGMQPGPSVYALSVAAFALQEQSWVVVTDYMDHKAWNIYYLALYRTCLPSSDSNQPFHFRDGEIGNHLSYVTWENSWLNSPGHLCQVAEVQSLKVSVREQDHISWKPYSSSSGQCHSLLHHLMYLLQ